MRRQMALMCGMLCLAFGRAALADADAERQLQDLFVQNSCVAIQADFICIKQMATPDAPLISSGVLYAARPESVRYSTTLPYKSDLILIDGKVYARTQHEKEWAKSSQSSKPGLTAVAGQIAGWSIGELRKIADYYDVAASGADLPAMPAEAAAFDIAKSQRFELTPTHQELKKVVERIQLAFDGTSGQLRFVRIFIHGGEIVIYWFSPIDNATLPRDIFETKKDR